MIKVQFWLLIALLSAVGVANAQQRIANAGAGFQIDFPDDWSITNEKYGQGTIATANAAQDVMVVVMALNNPEEAFSKNFDALMDAISQDFCVAQSYGSFKRENVREKKGVPPSFNQNGFTGFIGQAELMDDAKQQVLIEIAMHFLRNAQNKAFVMVVMTTPTSQKANQAVIKGIFDSLKGMP